MVFTVDLENMYLSVRTSFTKIVYLQPHPKFKNLPQIHSSRPLLVLYSAFTVFIKPYKVSLKRNKESNGLVKRKEIS